MSHIKFVDTLQFLITLIFTNLHHPQTLTTLNATKNRIRQSVIKECNVKYVFVTFVIHICLLTYNCDAATGCLSTATGCLPICS